MTQLDLQFAKAGVHDDQMLIKRRWQRADIIVGDVTV